MDHREEDKAWIPAPSVPLKSLYAVNAELVKRIAGRSSTKTSQATLDIDATLVEAFKKSALRCYNGFTSYQPLGVYRAEQELLLHSELRDGNVNAGTDILRVMVEALEWLPSGIKHVRVRSDSVAYQWSCLL